MAGKVVEGLRSPRRCAPRDDKVLAGGPGHCQGVDLLPVGWVVGGMENNEYRNSNFERGRRDRGGLATN